MQVDAGDAAYVQLVCGSTSVERVLAVLGLHARVYIDKFHFKGHKQETEDCGVLCNPHSVPGLTNTSACEQVNSWVSASATRMRYMSEAVFVPSLVFAFHMRNWGLVM